LAVTLKARLLGVIEAVQKEKDGTKERNDRLVAVPSESRLYQNVASIKNLPSELLWEIENFFKS
jgi:inorganic pyrophosphatase